MEAAVVEEVAEEVVVVAGEEEEEVGNAKTTGARGIVRSIGWGDESSTLP